MRKFLLLMLFFMSVGKTAWADDVLVFNLENPVVREYIQNVQYDSSDGYSTSEIEEYQKRETPYRVDLPFPVTLPCTNDMSDVSSVIVKIYQNGKLVRTDEFEAGEALDVYNLIPDKHYTYEIYGRKNGVETLLKSGEFKTTGQVRMINIYDMSNFRDLGGWPLPNRKRLKYDVLFRSMEMSDNSGEHIDDKGLGELTGNIGINAELDFSSVDGSPAIQYAKNNGIAYEFHKDSILAYVPAIVDPVGLKRCFDFVIESLKQNKKVLFHCNIGADRTGTFAFLLEGLLGVSESDLAKDYELTSLMFYGEKNKYGRFRNDPAFGDYKGMVEYIKNNYSGATLNEKIENFILGLGVAQEDIESLRELATESTATVDDVPVFNLENRFTQAFVHDFEYSADDYSYSRVTEYVQQYPWGEGDPNSPIPVVLEKPEGMTGASRVVVKMYLNGNVVRTDNFEASAPLEIYNLIPGKHYFYEIYAQKNNNNTLVKSGEFKTDGQVRMIYVPEMRNFRDLGGWPLPNGKRVKYDKIFRSGELLEYDWIEIDSLDPSKGQVPNYDKPLDTYVINDKGLAELTGNLGIGVELDFGDYKGSPATEYAQEHGFDYEFYKSDDYQIDMYKRGMTAKSGYHNKKQYKNCFELVLKSLKENKKLVFHCSAGADRTGSFAFLLESLLGVSENNLSKDYELTTFCRPTDKRYRNSDKDNSWKEMIDYFKTSFEGATFSDKVEQYMLQELGVTQSQINEFRDLMTEPAWDSDDIPVFNLENPAATDYIWNVEYPSGDYTTSLIKNYQGHSYREDLPLPVTIDTPNGVMSADSIIVKTYLDGIFVRSDGFGVDETLKIYNLIPQKHYTYQVYARKDGKDSLTGSGDFETIGQLRMINVPNVPNFRDLGGWPLPGGKRVKYNQIFRCAELSQDTPKNRLGHEYTSITKKGITELIEKLGIGVELDFGDFVGSPVANLAESESFDYEFYGPSGDEENPSDYQIFPNGTGLKTTKDKYKNCFKLALKCLREKKKMIFHCSVGADRTGTFAFLLEALLGVSESDLSKEYELTSLSKDYVGGYYVTRTRNCDDGHEGFYKETINYINTFSGSTINEKVEKYMLSIGITLDEINEFRDLMTEKSNTLVLDEAATKDPENTSNWVNIELKRSIGKNKWNTVILPFDLTGDQVKAAFGTNVKIAELTSWESDSDDNPTKITVKFTSKNVSKGIEANHPYIIKVTKDITNVTFDNMQVEPVAKPKIVVNDASFIGTYKKVLLPAKSLFISDNKFWYSTGKTMMKGYRAYLSLPVVVQAYNDGSSSAKVDLLVDDETTSVDGLQIVGSPRRSGVVYTLSGVCVGRDVDLSSLPKGVYIVDGRKYLVK